jgi:hypothetical protein
LKFSTPALLSVAISAKHSARQLFSGTEKSHKTTKSDVKSQQRKFVSERTESCLFVTFFLSKSSQMFIFFAASKSSYDNRFFFFSLSLVPSLSDCDQKKQQIK